jgi:hypothetical protein
MLHKTLLAFMTPVAKAFKKVEFPSGKKKEYLAK